MPTESGVTVVALNATSLNLLAGEIIEFVQQPSLVVVAAIASAVGLRMQFQITEERVVDDKEVSGANTFPKDPEDIFVKRMAVANDRLILKFRNTTGAGITVNWWVKSEAA